MPPVRLQAHSLAGGYGDLRVFADVDLELLEGECVGIVGPNGAGKTSVLRTIMGLCDQLGGELMLDGRPLARVSTLGRVRAGCILVPEGRELFAPLTARDNVLTGLGGRKRHGDLLAAALEVLPELEPHLDRKVGALSGGQQQMVALARAMVREPRVLLLDEPSQGLSPANADRITRAVIAMRERTSIVVVEQSLERILGFADRLYTMVEGRLSPVAPTEADDLVALESRYFGGT